MAGIDKDAIVGRGDPYDFWISTDWSTYSDTKQPNLRQVKAVDVTYGDGQKATLILDDKGQPFTHQAIRSLPPDTKQQGIYNQQTTDPRQTPQPVAPGGKATDIHKAADGQLHIYGYNPQTGLYDIDQGVAQQATTRQTEGTPDPSKPGGFDNDRPVMVTRDAQTHAIIKSEPLTAPERAQWEKDTGRAQGQKAREEVKDHPGIYHVVSTDANGNKDDHYEDASGRTVPQPQDVKTQIVDDGRGGKIAIISKPDGTFTTQTVSGIQGAPPTLTVSGTVYQLQPDGKTYAPAAGIDNPNAPIPANAPKYTPDYNAPDLGLTAYNEQLIQWNARGGGTRQQALQLLTQAGALADTTRTHGNDLTTQASTTRSQDITQRGQTLGEVQSRRTAADTGFDNTFSGISAIAPHLGAGNGGLAAAAFREALGLRQGYGVQAGGYTDVPPVPPSAAIQAARTTITPDGTIEVQHAPPVASAQSVRPVFTPGTPTNVQPGVSSAPSINPPSTEAGHDPSQPVGQVPAYLRPAQAQPLWSPDPVVAQLKQRGLSDAAIAQALQEHQQEYGTAA